MVPVNSMSILSRHMLCEKAVDCIFVSVMVRHVLDCRLPSVFMSDIKLSSCVTPLATFYGAKNKNKNNQSIVPLVDYQAELTPAMYSSQVNLDHPRNTGTPPNK